MNDDNAAAHLALLAALADDRPTAEALADRVCLPPGLLRGAHGDVLVLLRLLARDGGHRGCADLDGCACAWCKERRVVVAVLTGKTPKTCVVCGRSDHHIDPTKLFESCPSWAERMQETTL